MEAERTANQNAFSFYIDEVDDAQPFSPSSSP